VAVIGIVTRPGAELIFAVIRPLSLLLKSDVLFRRATSIIHVPVVGLGRLGSMLLPSHIASISIMFAAVSTFSAISASSADTCCEAHFLHFHGFALHKFVIEKDVGVELHGSHCS
jgi:hypothetical protein